MAETPNLHLNLVVCDVYVPIVKLMTMWGKNKWHHFITVTSLSYSYCIQYQNGNWPMFDSLNELWCIHLANCSSSVNGWGTQTTTEPVCFT